MVVAVGDVDGEVPAEGGVQTKDIFYSKVYNMGSGIRLGRLVKP